MASASASAAVAASSARVPSQWHSRSLPGARLSSSARLFSRLDNIVLQIGTSSDRGRAPFCVRAGLRAVESYDASFELEPAADATLRKALSSDVFCKQVAEQSKQGQSVRYEFTGQLFQPVPWSPTTKFGMPEEFERFLHDKENFMVINVPPNYMFSAKIFKPSRLCAIFKRV